MTQRTKAEYIADMRHRIEHDPMIPRRAKDMLRETVDYLEKNATDEDAVAFFQHMQRQVLGSGPPTVPKSLMDS